MSNALILGDPHIGRSLGIGKTGIGSNLNSRVADQLSLLDFVLDKAIEHSVGDIIITGDVFEDPKPHPSFITAFIGWLKKCQAYNITNHIIMGNHDMIRSGVTFTSSLDIINEMDIDCVNIYKNIDTIIIGSSAFTLVPFRDRKSFGASNNVDAMLTLRDSFIYELASIPVTYNKIMVGHLAIEGSIPVGDEIDDIANELFCPLDIFKGYDYVWMGHVHKPQIMKKKTPFISHIGSMDISNFGETDHKKYITIIDCDKNSNDNIFFNEYLPTRPLKKINIVVPKGTADTTQYCLDFIKKENKDFNQAIVKIEVSLSDIELKSISKSEIEKFILGSGAFNVTSISESKKTTLIKRDTKNTINTKMDTLSAIKTYAQAYVPIASHDSFIELAVNIYNTYMADAKD